MLQCPKHIKISYYNLEFNLCGKIVCGLCPRIPRGLQMHDEELTKEVLSFCPLPRLNVDGKTLLPIYERQRLMENGSSLADELKYQENLCGKFKDNVDDLVERKKRYAKLGNKINCSKARKVQKCDECMETR